MVRQWIIGSPTFLEKYGNPTPMANYTLSVLLYMPESWELARYLLKHKGLKSIYSLGI